MTMGNIVDGLKSALRTLVCFLFACLLLPAILISFLCVHYGNELVNYVLSIKYPTLTISKSKKIRTLIDTQRNAGIFHFLLQVEGPIDFESIRQHYLEHLIEVRDKIGLLRFPKLRQKLVTCWGHYAWVNDTSSFNINNHITLSSGTYRSRPVTEANVQEFVSELVTKYIPSDLPQWQVIVIPTTGLNENFYILVKVHHLIIAEEEDFHISELLMLQEYERRQPINIDEITGQVPKTQSSSYFVRQPEHICNLLQQVARSISNQWNAFIYEFESLETPDGYRRAQITNITQLLSVLLIIVVGVWRNYKRAMQARMKVHRRYPTNRPSYNRASTLHRILLKEVNDRHLTWQVAWNAVCNSCHPLSVVSNTTKCLWHLHISLPYQVFYEMLALRDIVFHGHTKHSSTYTARLAVYVPLLIYAQIEFLKICYELYKAPVNIYEELFKHPSKEANILQMKSYSGRKIVSFSKSIDATQLRKRIGFDSEVHESDFILSCLAGALHDYFQTYEHQAAVPQLLNTTCRTITKGYFTEHLGEKADHIGGVVFLQLPLQSPSRKHAVQLHTIVDSIRRKQIMIYLASMGQTRFDLLTALVPRVFTKICINFFSYNFPVTITEIHGVNSEFYTLWGQRVQDVLLFRPPQSKTCLSLNIHRFGDRYRLAIMADTQLGPDHSKITRAFETYMDTATL